MKKTLKFMLGAVLALSVLATAASAAGLRIGAAYWDAGEVSDALDDPLLGGELALIVPLSHPVNLELRAAVLGFSDDARGRLGNLDYDYDYTFGVVPLEAGLQMEIPAGNIALYGSIGLGWYFFTETSDIETHPFDPRQDDDFDEDDNTFGAYGTLGLRISLLPAVSIYGQAQYRYLFDEVDLGFRDSAIANEVFQDKFNGLDASGLAFSAGISIDL